MSGQPRLILHAANVHHGGGRSLLSALLSSLPADINLVLSLDDRMQLPVSGLQNIRINRVAPSIAGRIKAEKWLTDNARQGDLVLCFGNLPPLFKLTGRVLVFLQNRYLIDAVSLRDFSPRVRLRLALERIWFSLRMGNVDEFVVQSASMKALLDEKTGKRVPVCVLPFIGQSDDYDHKVKSSGRAKEILFDFLYVASGDPHKNHRQLIEAWCLLAEEDRYPSLRLTIDEHQSVELWDWISDKAKLHGLKIENSGSLEDAEIRVLYQKAGALIYPSTLESLGLPLVEARQTGLPVLASELDYVRDLLDPVESFDPASSVSIARAVKRFLRIVEEPVPMLNAGDFIDYVCKQLQ